MLGGKEGVVEKVMHPEKGLEGYVKVRIEGKISAIQVKHLMIVTAPPPPSSSSSSSSSSTTVASSTSSSSSGSKLQNNSKTKFKLGDTVEVLYDDVWYDAKILTISFKEGIKVKYLSDGSTSVIVHEFVHDWIRYPLKTKKRKKKVATTDGIKRHIGYIYTYICENFATFINLTYFS
jgi:hypothetical protein